MMASDLPGTTSAIESWLRQAVADHLSVDPDFIDLSCPLTDLGLDSLAVIHLSAALGARLGIELDPMILVGAANLSEVARLVASLAADGASIAGSPTVAGPPILVWASFSPEPLAEALARALDRTSQAVAIKTARFAADGRLPQPEAPGQVLVAALRLADRPPEMRAGERAQQIVRDIAEHYDSFARVIILLCPEPPGDEGADSFDRLAETLPGIDILDGRSLLAGVYDQAADAMGRVPYKAAAFDALAASLAQSLESVGVAMAAKVPTIRLPRAQLILDAACPAEIGRMKPPSRDSWRTILLTGATGFVGAHLLDALLTHTEATVECHVRAANPAEAVARVRANLERHGLWRSDYAARILGLAGDLSLPRLGLATDEWARLAGSLDAIIHNGAAVNFVYSYDALKPANVDATADILRLAATGRTKPLHFVSTIGIITSGSDNAPVAEDCDPGDPGHLANGYEQSKWVADRMVAAAIARGLPGSLYRLGLVSGHSRSGHFAHDDFLSALIVTSLSLGAMPDLGGRLPMIPVDIVADALVAIACKPENLGRCYHLVHPEPMTSRYLAALAALRGYDVRLLPWQAWRHAAVQPGWLAGTELEPYTSFLRNADTLALPELAMSNALAAAESVIGSAPPQRDLLGRLLDGFVAKGRLAPPDKRHTARSTVTRLVAMDVDRTLIEGQSQSYLGRGLRRAGLLPWRMYIRMLWWFLLHHSFGWRPANPTRLQRIALNYLAGIPIDRLLPVFHEVVEREILPRVRPAALAEMRRWQDDGALVFLVSASVEPLIGLLALALRADGVIATKIRDGGAVFSGELDGEMVAGPMKWQRLTEAADALFRAWRLEAAYGDDDTDLALLSQAKRAFPVNPTAGLRSAAIERGWTILDWAVRATGESGSRRG